MKKKDSSACMDSFLNGAVSLAGKIKDHSKEAGRLLIKLEKTSDFRSLIEQEHERHLRFKEESQAFARSIRSFAKEFPLVMADLMKVISALQAELEVAGYVIVKEYPRYSISFDKRRFEFMIEEEGVEVDKGRLKELEKEENALIKDLAEVIALDFHIRVVLEEISASVKEKKIMRLCRAVEKDGSRIDDLHVIVVWWKNTKDTLLALKKVTYAAIELDEKAFRILKRIESAEKMSRLKETHLPLVVGWLGVVGEITLNIIPGGGIVQSAVALKRGAKLYRETHAMIRSSD